MEDRFFVIYPKLGFAETDKIIRDITDRLGIDYQLWSYSDVFDEYDYYKKVVEPAIEKAEFVMVFLTKEPENEFLVSESVRFCSNLNKSLIPIKLKNSDVKDDAEFDEKKWNIRSKAVDFSEEIQRIRFFEQLYAWLGLVSKGDTYGSKVFISTKPGSIISRDKEVLGTADGKGMFKCTLAKGSGNIDIKSDNCWNRYMYSVNDNDSELHFEASLSGVCKLSKIGASSFKSVEIPKWDITNRDDFVLVASSEDKKKKEIIYNYYDKSYRFRMKPYPRFSSEKIGFSDFADINLVVGMLFGVILTIVGIIFMVKEDLKVGGYIALGGLIAFVFMLTTRLIRIRVCRKRIMHRRQNMINEVDKYNESVRSDVNDMMNRDLLLRGLPVMSLLQHPAPDSDAGAIKPDADISLESEDGNDDNDEESEELSKKRTRYILISLIIWSAIAFVVMVIATNALKS